MYYHLWSALGIPGYYTIIDTVPVVKWLVHPPSPRRTQLQIINDEQFMRLI